MIFNIAQKSEIASRQSEAFVHCSVQYERWRSSINRSSLGPIIKLPMLDRKMGQNMIGYDRIQMIGKKTQGGFFLRD